jgi:cyclophilin family peptidyl-prolyl cis-trans isomerase
MGASGAFAADGEFELTLDGPSSGTAALGAEIRLEVTLGKKRGKPETVHALRLARNSVSFRVTREDRTFLVTRIYGREWRREDGTFVLADAVAPRSVLHRGRPLRLVCPMLAMITGKHTIQAVYRGLPTGPAELVSEPIVVEVVSEEDRERLGAVIETSEGALRLTLWPERAYLTVLNFLSLAKAGRYDGLTFHRVLRHHLIQGGDPKGDGTGRTDWSIPGEFDPEILHEKGVISMARAAPLPDSAGVQFFIMHGADPRLDGKYAAFGRVVEGLDVLDRLASVKVRRNPKSDELSLPEEPPFIRAVRIVAE